mmetsp:Transcript_36683/g.84394  ORF Transcript_36683/g.84394 Transcript_36683/m.84394 type:complete len:673 (+) Transcript_36683:42-2060(+)
MQSLFTRLPGVAEDDVVDLPSPLRKPDGEPPPPPNLTEHAPKSHLESGDDLRSLAWTATSSVLAQQGWLDEMRCEFDKQEKRLELLLQTQEARLVSTLQKCITDAAPSGTVGRPTTLPNLGQHSERVLASIGGTVRRTTSSGGPPKAWSGDASAGGAPVRSMLRPRETQGQHGRASKRAMVALAKQHTKNYKEAILKMHDGAGVGMEDHSTSPRLDQLGSQDFPWCFWCQSTARSVVESRRFEFLVATFIIVNAIFIGVQGDWAIQHVDEELPWTIRAVNVVFTAFFTLEIFLRIFVEGSHFIDSGNPHFWWNVLDAIVVLSAIGEEVANILALDAGNLSVLRLLRILRMARFVRFFRVMRFFRDLRVMVHGIMGSMRALLWCMLLLLLVMYMFAVLVIQIVKLELESIHDSRQSAGWDLNPDLVSRESELKEHFGSMLLCLFSLFKCVMGGVDWGEQAELLREIHPIWLVPFTLYICFAMLCVLNVVTGVFVENANKLTAQDQDHVVMEELSARKAWFDEVKRIFRHADMDGSGFVDLPEFTAVISDPRVKMIFRKVGIDVETISPQGLFNMFAAEHTDFISIEEFLVGVQQFHGHARALDVAKVLHLVKQQRAQHAMELAYVGGLCEQSLQRQVEQGRRITDFLAAISPAVATQARSDTLDLGDIEQFVV